MQTNAKFSNQLKELAEVKVNSGEIFDTANTKKFRNY